MDKGGFFANKRTLNSLWKKKTSSSASITFPTNLWYSSNDKKSNIKSQITEKDSQVVHLYTIVIK